MGILFWTKEKCQEEALKYDSLNQFYKNSKAYHTAHKKGWLDEITSHMTRLRTPLSKNECREIASRYQIKKDFIKSQPSCYVKIIKNGWSDELLSHQSNSIKPNGYWTKDKCKYEALKYTSRMQFKENSMAAYTQSVKHKWLDEVCEHMSVIGNKALRYVYIFAFEDNHVYVGLTHDINERVAQHMSKTKNRPSPVLKHIEKTNNNYVFNVLTESPIPVKEAGIMEKNLIAKYNSEGWIVLNKTKGGEYGGSTPYWTKERCASEALKYNTRSDLKKYSNGCYHCARKNGYLFEICQHMLKPKESLIKWTDDEIRLEVEKYKNKTELRKNNEYVYKLLYKNNSFEKYGLKYEQSETKA